MTANGPGHAPACGPEHCPNRIVARVITEVAHGAIRRSELPALLAHLGTSGADVSVAIQAALETRKVEILEMVLETFVAESCWVLPKVAPFIETADRPTEAARLLVRAGLDLSTVIRPIAKLALRERKGTLMAALLRRERARSLAMDPACFQPYLLTAEPIPCRDWMVARPKPVLDEILLSALTRWDFPVAEAALALGASSDAWSPDQVDMLREHIPSPRHSPRSLRFDEMQGAGSGEALIKLAISTTSAHGKLAAKRRYPDLDRLLGLAASTPS